MSNAISLPPGYDDLPEEERHAALLLKWAHEMETAAAARNTDDFEVITESVFYVRACTTLDDETATARVNSVPSGTQFGWVLCTGEGQTPVPCDDKPETHRHLMWEC